MEKIAINIDPTRNFTHKSDYVLSDEEEEEEEGDDEDDGEDGFEYRGRYDKNDLFHGEGTLTFDNGEKAKMENHANFLNLCPRSGDVIRCNFKNGIRHGDAIIECPREGILRLCGSYVDGKLQGPGRIVSH